jgi:hypothetical protein
MQFLCSTAFRKHMIVSSVAILAIFSTYPSYAGPLFNPTISHSSSIPAMDHIILAECSNTVSRCEQNRHDCMHNPGSSQFCERQYLECRQRAGC